MTDDRGVTPAVRRSLRATASDPRGAFFLDFDGTLSTIVRDPARSRPVRGARPALRALVAAGAHVVVLSGRPASFIARVVAVPGVTYAGLYGAEERLGRARRVHPAAEAGYDAVRRARARLRRELPGLLVEDKGFAVAVHARRAPDPEAAMRRAEQVVREVAREEGLRIARGRLVLELGARGVPDKGTTLAEMCARLRLRRAVVAGDDIGDLAMFTAARDAVPRSLVMWVANAEAPRRLARAADVIVPSQMELVSLLREAAGTVSPAARPAAR